MRASICKFLKAAGRNDGGNLSIIFATTLPVLLMTSGAALDLTRWLDARSKTKSALDSAVLSGARALQLDPGNSSNALAVAKSSYDGNVAKRLPLASDSVQFVITPDNKGVTATGAAAIQTTFLRIVGIQALPLVGGAGAKFPIGTVGIGGMGGGDVEVAVMLDVTGSMCDDGNGPCNTGTKVSGLKDAAKDLVNIVLQTGSDKYTSRIALVPFSTRVRVEANSGSGTLMKSMTNLNRNWTGYRSFCTKDNGVSGGSEHGTAWQCLESQVSQTTDIIMPCVTDRYYNNGNVPDTTDDAPGPGKWLNAHGGDRMPLSGDSSDTPPVNGTGTTAADPSYDWNYTSYSADCADASNNNIVMPLTTDKAALNSRIDGLEAYGSTSGPLGTAFAWYMLSPKWNSVWGTTAGPYSDLTTLQANGAPKLRKVAVLMTDGEYNTLRGWKDQDQVVTSAVAKQFCANMKAQGIEIYTVGLALDQLQAQARATAIDTLQSCGTDVKHFYQTLTIADLQVAFREIALNLTSVRLSE